MARLEMSSSSVGCRLKMMMMLISSLEESLSHGTDDYDDLQGRCRDMGHWAQYESVVLVGGGIGVSRRHSLCTQLV